MRRPLVAVSLLGVGLLAGCFAQIDRSKLDASDGGADAETDPTDCDAATLCDDFERTTLLGPWFERGGDKDTRTELSSRRARSGTRSFEVGVPDSLGGGGYLRTSSTTVARQTRFHFSLFVESTFTERTVSATRLGYRYDGGREVDVYVGLEGRSSTVAFVLVERGVAPEVHYALMGRKANLVRGRWVDVSIELEHDATPTLGTLRYDGELVLERAPLPRDIPPRAVSLEFGLTYADRGPPAVFAFDDVRFDAVP